MEREIPIHPDLVWDYDEPPKDPIWRLQRIADAFPAYGRDRYTVEMLALYKDQLKLQPETRALIEIYREVWAERGDALPLGPDAGRCYSSDMVRVVHWNGKDIPDELRDLPAGRYVLESLDEPPVLTEEEEEGLREALRSLRAGKGRSLAEVRETIDDALER